MFGNDLTISAIKAEMCSLDRGNFIQEQAPRFRGRLKESAYNNGTSSVADILNSHRLVPLTRTGKENASRLGNGDEFWILVFCVPWCHFCKFAARTVEGSYYELADKLMGIGEGWGVGADIGVLCSFGHPLDVSSTLQIRGMLIC